MCGPIRFRKALYSNSPYPASARTWMPDLMKEYDDLQLKLLGLNIFIRAVFPGSPFFATTLNMGPQTVCFAHRDYWNLLHGTCGIGALGPFDHRTGGHLILHETQGNYGISARRRGLDPIRGRYARERTNQTA